MSRFVLISGDGDGLGIAFRLKDEGHSVIATVRNNKVKHDYDGLLEKVAFNEFSRVLTKDTVIIFDSNGGGRTADRLRGEGYPVMPASTFADQLELDRHLAADIMKEAGVKVPYSEHFTDWEAGIKYVDSKQERLCYKADNNGATSYLSTCAEDMIEFLRNQQGEGEKPDFELQDFVKGLEISSEGWFDGYEFAQPLNHTFERKQLMNDDIGPSSGCAGNVVWACTETYCPICEMGIKRLAPVLRYHGYRGPIDQNSIVNDQGVWWLELTPRFGFDAFPALLETLTEPLGDLLAKYARGERVAKFPMRDKGFGAGLRVTIPPYPTDTADAAEDIPIRELVRSDRQHSFFYNVYLDKKAQLRSSGAFGAIAVFTAFGDTIYDAMGKCTEIAHRVEVRDKQFRTDLDSVFAKYFEEFKELQQKLTAAPQPA